MKRLFFFNISLLLGISVSYLAADSSGPCGSKSFFRTRSTIENVDLYLALNEYYYHHAYFENGDECEDSYNKNFAVGMFYEKSNRHNIGSYFLPHNKCAVTIAENGTGDIGSLWLKVVAPDGLLYSSTLSLCPTRSAWGGYFNYHHYFSCVDGLWVDLKFAAYKAKHNLHPCERIDDVDALGTLPNAATALQYLASNELAFGRIASCSLSRSGFDDIEFKIGYDAFGCYESGYYVGLFGSVLFPTAPRPNAVYLFEPLIGRSHWGLGGGLKAGTGLYECGNHSLALMTEVSYQYLFKREERRSFDLKNNGEWSRYLRVAKQTEPAVSFPAINFTTLCADVTPRGVLNWWTALHYERCNWHGEVGYNLWWRQAEKICLSSCVAECFDAANIGIFGMGNVCTPTSASNATISQGKTFTGTGNVVVNDATFVQLTSNDLNLCSAAHPRVLTNKVYGALARDFECYCRPFSVGIGASYEIAREISAIQQWGVWGNFEMSF